MKCPLMLSWGRDVTYYEKSQYFYCQIEICGCHENDEVLLLYWVHKAYMRREYCLLRQGNYS